mmetsp:Transcript_6974/g.28385  ORF Transcript_6974/g.28385 Transcript_6974/m.28385 type:complete len:128 (-) Transcript_6974:931-1314(-)
MRRGPRRSGEQVTSCVGTVVLWQRGEDYLLTFQSSGRDCCQNSQACLSDLSPHTACTSTTTQVAYDEAIRKSPGGLTEVLLRNVYFCEGEYERARVLEEYVRYKIGCLGVTASDALLEGRVRFANTQ